MSSVFSAIAVLYTMLFGRAPWHVDFTEGMTRAEKVAAVKLSRKSPLDLDGVELPDNIKYLLEQGLSQDTNGGGFDDLDQVVSVLEGKTSSDREDKGKRGSTSVEKKSGPSQQESVQQSPDVTIKKGGGNGFKDKFQL